MGECYEKDEIIANHPGFTRKNEKSPRNALFPRTREEPEEPKEPEEPEEPEEPTARSTNFAATNSSWRKPPAMIADDRDYKDTATPSTEPSVAL